MRHPITQTVLFLAIGIGLLGGLYTVSERVAPTYADVKTRMSLLQAKANSITAIAAGNSHSVAIDFKAMGVNGFHVWMPGSDLLETRYIVEEVVPMLPNLKYVLVPASPFLFHRDNLAVVNSDRSDLRRETYAFTTSFRFLEGDMSNFVQARLSPIARPNHWKGFVSALSGKPPEEHPVRPDGFIEYFQDRSDATAAFLEKDGTDKAAENVALQEEMQDTQPDLVENAYDALAALAASLEAEDIQMVLYTPPIYPAYLNHFDPAITEEMKSLVMRLDAKYDNLSYYDFSRDTAFVYNPVYFRDSDHLNVAGAAVFSERLKSVAGIY